MSWSMKLVPHCCNSHFFEIIYEGVLSFSGSSAFLQKYVFEIFMAIGKYFDEIKISK
jgi:hypothetical protein